MEAIIGGAIGAILALVCEHTYLYFKEKRKEEKQREISFPNNERNVDKNVFEKLGPGRSVELMKAALGTPDQTYVSSEPVFTKYREEEEGLFVMEFETTEDEEKYHEDKFKTTVYFYDLKNAQVKLTSKDRETINSLAVNVKDDIRLDISDLPMSWAAGQDENDDGLLIWGETRVEADLVAISRAEYYKSRYDDTFILSVYTAAPLYTHYTYFGHPNYEAGIDVEVERPETFIGGTITGVCLHGDEFDCHVISGHDNL